MAFGGGALSYFTIKLSSHIQQIVVDAAVVVVDVVPVEAASVAVAVVEVCFFLLLPSFLIFSGGATRGGGVQGRGGGRGAPRGREFRLITSTRFTYNFQVVHQEVVDEAAEAVPKLVQVERKVVTSSSNHTDTRVFSSLKERNTCLSQRILFQVKPFTVRRESQSKVKMAPRLNTESGILSVQSWPQVFWVV